MRITFWQISINHNTMQNNTAIHVPATFSFINLQAFVNELLISLSVARVTIIFEKESTDIVTTVLSCKESANVKWYTLNIDRPYKDETYFTGSSPSDYRDLHLVVLAFNSSDWLGVIEVQYLIESLKWQWHGSSQYLLVTDNEDAEEQDIHRELRGFRKYLVYAALLRYRRSGIVEIFKLPDNGQLVRLLYSIDTERSVAASLHHFLFTTDQFVDLNGRLFTIYSHIYVPYLYYAKLDDSSDKLDENTVGGTNVLLATMIGRYLNVTISFITMDYLDYAAFKQTLLNYTIQEVLKVRRADEILGSSINDA